jgi:CheY-like chemotaxis protein
MTTRCKNILIIEDDLAIREALRDVLEMEGYKIYSAANGKEGLEYLPKMIGPCLILLDLMMPVMNGWEVAAALRDDTILATIPVVVVTAYPAKAKEVQARSIIRKPIDLEVLLNIVSKYCDQRNIEPDEKKKAA